MTDVGVLNAIDSHGRYMAEAKEIVYSLHMGEDVRSGDITAVVEWLMEVAEDATDDARTLEDLRGNLEVAAERELDWAELHQRTCDGVGELAEMAAETIDADELRGRLDRLADDLQDLKDQTWKDRP